MISEMSGFRWEHQDELLRQYTDKFFEVVRNVFKNREKEFADAFFGSVRTLTRNISRSDRASSATSVPFQRYDFNQNLQL
jgi:hypothetical protein